MKRRANGEGSFSIAKNRPNAPITFRKRINGKVVTVQGKTNSECIKKMKEKEAKIHEEAKLLHPTDSNVCVLLKDSIKYWLKNSKKPTIKARSYDRIYQIYRAHIENNAIGRISVNNVTDKDIQKLLNDVSVDKSDSTIKKLYELLNMYFRQYYIRDNNNNPMLTVIKPTSKKDKAKSNSQKIDEEQILTDEEIEKLTRELTQPYINGKGGYKCGYMLLFLIWSYVRLGEALALQYKDLIYDQSEPFNYALNINKGFSLIMNYDSNKKEWELTTPKTPNSVRKIPLYTDAITSLTTYIALYRPNIKANDYIFETNGGQPISDQHLNFKLKQALSRCNIEKDISVHDLRHTGISYFLRHGVDIATISRTAGHSSITVTQNVYYNIINSQIKGMFDNMK